MIFALPHHEKTDFPGPHISIAPLVCKTWKRAGRSIRRRGCITCPDGGELMGNASIAMGIAVICEVTIQNVSFMIYIASYRYICLSKSVISHSCHSYAKLPEGNLS